MFSFSLCLIPVRWRPTFTYTLDQYHLFKFHIFLSFKAKNIDTFLSKSLSLCDVAQRFNCNRPKTLHPYPFTPLQITVICSHLVGIKKYLSVQSLGTIVLCLPFIKMKNKVSSSSVIRHFSSHPWCRHAFICRSWT